MNGANYNYLSTININITGVSSNGTVIVLQIFPPTTSIDVIPIVGGNIFLNNGQTHTLTGYNTLQLIFRSNNWYELSRTIIPMNPPSPQQAVLTISQNAPSGTLISSNGQLEANITISQPGTYSLNNFVSSNNSYESLLYSYNPAPQGIIFNTSMNNGITTTTMTIQSGYPQIFDIAVTQPGNNYYSPPNTVQLYVTIEI